MANHLVRTTVLAMSMVINSNIAALRSLALSQANLNQAMERLSSGLRINSAKDDAAGSAIVSVLTSQVRGLNQATRNANDGISLLQTAEGALSEIGTVLQRMRELSVQAANGTYSQGDRNTLNQEVKQLAKAIDDISKSTNFNGQTLLDGTLIDLDLQVGAEIGQTINVGIRKIDAETLGISDTAGLGSFQRKSRGEWGGGLTSAISNLPEFKSGDLILNGVTIGSSLANADTASSAANDKSTIAIAAAINAKTSETNVKAIVGETTVCGSMMQPSAVNALGTIQLNGVDIQLPIVANDTAATRVGITEAINRNSKQTGVVATNTGNDASGITLSAADGRNIVIFNRNGDLGPDPNHLDMWNTGISIGDEIDFGNSVIFTSTMTLVSTDGKNIEIDNSPLGTSKNAGLFVGSYSGNKTSISSEPTLNQTHVATKTGDILINGVPIPGSNARLKEKVAAINSVSAHTGVVARLGENRTINSVIQGTTAGLVSGSINGVEITGFVAQAGPENTSANRAMLVKQVNAISGQTGVEAFDTGVDGTSNGGGVTLVAKDGREIINSLTNGNLAGADAFDTADGRIILESDHEIVVANAYDILTSIWMNSTSFTDGTYGGGQGGQSLRNLDISTQEGANKAIKAIDNALTRVTQVRANLGAVTNRLDFTVNNLNGISQNTSASRSRIEDADFAAETANLSKSQVLQQASTAILAQANALPQQILSLLK